MRDPEVFSGFSLRGRRIVELNVLADALDGAVKPVVQLYGSPTALTRQWLALIATLHMLFKLRVWRDEYLLKKYWDPP